MFSEPLHILLTDTGFCSRRAAKNFVIKNEVVVKNLKTGAAHQIRETEISRLIDSETAVFVNGRQIEKPKRHYFLLNKPKGFVCSKESDRSPVIYSLINGSYPSLHTVGRLDKDTEGIILLTDNGSFSNRLAHDDFEIAKTYEAELEHKFTEEEAALAEKLFKKGFKLPAEKKADAFVTKPAKITFSEDFIRCRITVTEGKFHQIKRMCAFIHNPVINLKRISIANLELPEDLKPGEYLELSEQDLMKKLKFNKNC